MFGVELKFLLTNAIGFLLLVVVLRKLAWGRLLGAIDARRLAIKREIEAAEAQHAEAARQRKDYETRMAAIEAEARSKVAEAVADGQRIAAEIKEQTRVEATDMIAKAEERIRLEQAQALVALRDDVVRLTMMATEKVVKESMDGARHERMIRDFLREVEGTRV